MELTSGWHWHHVSSNETEVVVFMHCNLVRCWLNCLVWRLYSFKRGYYQTYLAWFSDCHVKLIRLATYKRFLRSQSNKNKKMKIGFISFCVVGKAYVAFWRKKFFLGHVIGFSSSYDWINYNPFPTMSDSKNLYISTAKGQQTNFVPIDWT